jgi:adenylate cyclase
MEETRAKRRLAAILAADVVGYSQLVGMDEEGALARLHAVHREVVLPKVAMDNGRIVKTMGDGYLVEFASVVDAVRGAVAIQNAMAERNRDTSDLAPIEFRIGINLGDIVIDGEDILGDGVNIAARLESIADPGCIYLSRAAFDQVEGKFGLETEFLGERELKNISRPVGVYRIVPEVGKSAASQGKGGPEAPYKVPEKPSIAVLPLDNMSGDRDQEYFTDGMTEDIITELSRFSQLFVIARNSSFTYKGRAVKIQDVRKELGVRYVVEGSVRKANDRVRVTIQLIDAGTGSHVWAERYDREIVDIFEVQDELTRAIVAAVAGRVDAAEKDRIKRMPPDPMAALDYLVAGRIHHHKVTPHDNAKAVELLDQAIALDPQFAEAYAWKACTLGQAMEFGFGERKQIESAAMAALTKAIALDENNVECHRLFCEIYMETHDLDRALVHGERAISLNPNDPRLVAQQGELRTWLGAADEAVEWLKKAIRVDPHGAGGRAHLLGRALYGQHNYADSLETFRKITKPRYDRHAFMAASYGQLGRTDEAKAQAALVLQLKPDFTVGNYVASLPYANQSDRDHLAEGLGKAGLPD